MKNLRTLKKLKAVTVYLTSPVLSPHLRISMDSTSEATIAVIRPINPIHGWIQSVSNSDRRRNL